MDIGAVSQPISHGSYVEEFGKEVAHVLAIQRELLNALGNNLHSVTRDSQPSAKSLDNTPKSPSVGFVLGDIHNNLLMVVQTHNGIIQDLLERIML